MSYPDSTQLSALYLQSMVAIHSLIEELMATTGCDFASALAAILASGQATRFTVRSTGLAAYNEMVANLKDILRLDDTAAANAAAAVLMRATSGGV